MATPYTFENSLRAHDAAVVAWLQTLHVDYGAGNAVFTYDAPKNDTPVIVVMAPPERAFAEIITQLTKLAWITDAEVTRLGKEGAKIEQIPLPALSLVRGDPQPDTELAGVPKYLRSPSDTVDPDTGKPFIYPYPAHYRTPYTVTFWSIKRYTDAFLREWIMGQLGNLGCNQNELLLSVRHAAPFGTTRQAMRFDGVSDLSDLEGTDPRTFRFEASFNLRTWVLKTPVTHVGPEYP